MRFQPVYHAVLDTETVRIKGSGYVIYDIAWVISTTSGKVVKEESFLINGGVQAFAQSPWGKKLEAYPAITPIQWADALKALLSDIETYDIADILAYNAGYDKRAIAHTCSYFGVSLPDLPRWDCIQYLGCQSYMNTYRYCDWCDDHMHVTEKGYVKTCAQSAYGYYTKNPDFSEAHRALDDCHIELDLWQRARRQGKKLQHGIYSACWRIPQAKHRAVTARV